MYIQILPFYLQTGAKKIYIEKWIIENYELLQTSGFFVELDKEIFDSEYLVYTVLIYSATI